MLDRDLFIKTPSDNANLATKVCLNHVKAVLCGSPRLGSGAVKASSVTAPLELDFDCADYSAAQGQVIISYTCDNHRHWVADTRPDARVVPAD